MAIIAGVAYPLWRQSVLHEKLLKKWDVKIVNQSYLHACELYTVYVEIQFSCGCVGVVVSEN